MPELSWRRVYWCSSSRLSRRSVSETQRRRGRNSPPQWAAPREQRRTKREELKQQNPLITLRGRKRGKRPILKNVLGCRFGNVCTYWGCRIRAAKFHRASQRFASSSSYASNSLHAITKTQRILSPFSASLINIHICYSFAEHLSFVNGGILTETEKLVKIRLEKLKKDLGSFLFLFW